MRLDFIFQPNSARVVFGAGSLRHLEREVGVLGAERALVVSTPGQRPNAEAISKRLGERAAGVYDRAAMHVPIETALEARNVVRELDADCVIAIGGGSTIGLAKAIALDSPVPILAIPTTYAGSEMTPIYGITEAGLKRTGRDVRVLPRTVIYDPDLTLSLPPSVRLTSGINAVAHAAEALYAHDRNPISTLMAEEGIAAIRSALERFGSDADDAYARAQALYGAWLCGTVLGAVSMGLHHKLCHTLGGTFNLPHAETHTVMLPHTLAYNAPCAEEAMARASRALRHTDAASAVFELSRRHGGPASLRELGMPEAGLDRVADLAAANPYPNPRPLERHALRAMLQRAWHGLAPSP